MAIFKNSFQRGQFGGFYASRLPAEYALPLPVRAIARPG
jgi:hypothetical protein